jgi:hypothetical protein
MITIGLLAFAGLVFAYGAFWLILAYRYRSRIDVRRAVTLGAMHVLAASLVLVAVKFPASGRYAIAATGLLLFVANAVVLRSFVIRNDKAA